MENKLSEILDKLESIEKRLEKLEDDSSSIKTSCRSMDNHITFIDMVYSKLRYPLDWITNKITGNSNLLPDNPNSKLQEEDIVECTDCKRIYDIYDEDCESDRIFSL